MKKNNDENRLQSLQDIPKFNDVEVHDAIFVGHLVSSTALEFSQSLFHPRSVLYSLYIKQDQKILKFDMSIGRGVAKALFHVW